MMFVFSIILLTSCSNLITFLRSTKLRFFIPFDAAFQFHVVGGITCLFFVCVHVLGHFINFFSVATESSFSLACLFREVNWVTNFLPAFYWWIFRTPTGVSGYILTQVCVILAVFSVKMFRTHYFFLFELIHKLCAFVIYGLMLIHGWAQLVQVPLFHTFLIGPLFLYVMDKLVSLSRREVAIQVRKSEWLPSGVLHLEFERPKEFNYKAGQSFRIACTGISGVTFHPFTITSAPHEKHLSAHIRSVGPWTRKIHDIYNPQLNKFPPVLIDGPFGAVTDLWATYEHVIFVGAGIGVTPYASILKDFVYRSKNHIDFPVKKLIFFWVCRSQKQFEWMVDIIKEAELGDIHKRLEVHIFVTELNRKFDLRTIMLYIAEKQFYQVNSASLFTGLQASTHFGRPNFEDLFKQIQKTIRTDTIAVFSCVPSNMLNDIESACTEVSKLPGSQFQHFSESFY